MENEVPLIQPKTWESAAGLCAWQIDKHHKLRIEKMESHPSWLGAPNDSNWMTNMREEYDGLTEEWYGSDDGPAWEWFKNLASTTMLAAYVTGVAYALTAESILPLLERKQLDYGYENINRFGRDGILVRMHDKIARIENLVDNTDGPSNESLMNSFVDLVGYSIIGMMWEYEIWTLPMEKN